MKKQNEPLMSIKIKKDSVVGKKIIKISDKYNISYNAAFKVFIENLMNKQDTEITDSTNMPTTPQKENNPVINKQYQPQEPQKELKIENITYRNELQEENDEAPILSAKDLSGLI